MILESFRCDIKSAIKKAAKDDDELRKIYQKKTWNRTQGVVGKTDVQNQAQEVLVNRIFENLDNNSRNAYKKYLNDNNDENKEILKQSLEKQGISSENVEFYIDYLYKATSEAEMLDDYKQIKNDNAVKQAGHSILTISTTLMKVLLNTKTL